MSAPRSVLGEVLAPVMVGALVLSAFAFVLYAMGGGNVLKAMIPTPGETPPARIVTKHEGPVTKIVVVDPHNGGWSERLSNPTDVELTVNGHAYDLDGELKQAASVKLGDVVVISCSSYAGDTREPWCSFAGLVMQAPPNPKRGN